MPSTAWMAQRDASGLYSEVPSPFKMWILLKAAQQHGDVHQPGSSPFPTPSGTRALLSVAHFSLCPAWHHFPSSPSGRSILPAWLPL